MMSSYLYLGYILARGDEYCFETTKFDIELANQVKGMQAELSDIQSKIDSISSVNCDDMFGADLYVLTNEYTAYQANVRPEMGASHNIPLSTTTAIDIIADDIKG